MSFEKITDFLRQVLSAIIIIYLTKKLFNLEDRVLYLENKLTNKSSVIEDEYSTENDFQPVRKLVNSSEKSSFNIQLPTETSQVQSSSETKDNLTQDVDEESSLTKLPLKQIQEMALKKNIDIKSSGKNKTKKQLIEELK